MLSQEIRRKFLNYFKNHNHQIVPSSPVIPHDDPTLLFINAGMNQFKDIFLGKAKQDYVTATSSQKCIRVGGKHNDLENVGHTTRHLTFFEMLGNFSFGNYFKKEAIQFAWEVTTDVFGLDPDKIWVSVFLEDDEAFALWENYIPSSRIVRLGEKDNFWAMGAIGPCGPCSELLYDRGPNFSNATNPYEDHSGERFFEFWNLVFMQYNRTEEGSLQSLPQKNIDTGSGLERVVSLKMGVKSLFQTDILRSLISTIEEISNKKYEIDSSKAPSFHVIADHIRTLSFAIADGVQPSNTDRGYVLRKVLRRAVRYARTLGITQPFLPRLFPTLLHLMGKDFPELEKSQERIQEILTIEEEAFSRTLQRGGNIFFPLIEKAKSSQSGISGEDAFKLKDTFGFPIEEIALIAKDEGISIDLHRFEELEKEAKTRSKQAQKKEGQTFDSSIFANYLIDHPSPCFTGYKELSTEALIVAIVKEGAFVPSLEEGEEALILLDKSPFYGEMGGQVGDTGTLHSLSPSKTFCFRVSTTIYPYTKVLAHKGRLEKGSLHVGDLLEATVDRQRREEIQNNHTATHLLHFALHKLLGSHIKQAGSLVENSKIRFDFTHHKPLTKEEIYHLERLINEQIRSDLPVKIYEMAFSEVQKQEDIKQFFGEKYGNTVRVIDMGLSKELCGGTHTSSLGTIGFAKIIKESSIAAGVRRVEMVTGRFAEEFVQEQEKTLSQAAELLKTPENALLERVTSLLDERDLLLKKIKEMREEKLDQLYQEALSHIKTVRNINALIIELPLLNDEIHPFADKLLKSHPSLFILLAIKTGPQCQIVLRISEDLVAKGILANEWIKKLAPIIRGGGGGTKTAAQAGGKDASKLQDLFTFVTEELTSLPGSTSGHV